MFSTKSELHKRMERHVLRPDSWKAKVAGIFNRHPILEMALRQETGEARAAAIFALQETYGLSPEVLRWGRVLRLTGDDIENLAMARFVANRDSWSLQNAAGSEGDILTLRLDGHSEGQAEYARQQVKDRWQTPCQRMTSVTMGVEVLRVFGKENIEPLRSSLPFGTRRTTVTGMPAYTAAAADPAVAAALAAVRQRAPG